MPLTDPSGAAVPALLSTEEAARLLRVHANTVKSLCRSGKLPALKIGRQWRIRPADVLALRAPSPAPNSALETLVRSAQHLNSQLGLDDALRAVCAEARHNLDLPAAWINLYDPARDVLDFAVADGMPPEFGRQYRSPARALLDERVQELGPLLVVPDVRLLSANPNAEIYAALDIRMVVSAVMRYQDRLIGVLSVVTFHEARELSPDELALLDGLANQAALAIANAQLFEGLQRELVERRRADEALLDNRRQLRTLSRRLVEVQEDERRALSRELHDASGQSITAVKLGLGALKRERDCPDGIRAKVEDLLDLADTVSEDLHRLAVTLRPASLDRYGLVAAIEQLLVGFRQQYGLRADFDAHGPDGLIERLPDYVETALYRIAQESLTNVARHAQADAVAVILERREDTVRMIVEDDGRGFDVEEALRTERLGLLGMRERAEMLGGRLEIESSPGHGTSVYATVPAVEARVAGGAAERAGDAWSSAPGLEPEEGAASLDPRPAEAAELARSKVLGDALLDITAAIAGCSDADEILRLVLGRSAEAIGRENAHIAVPSGGRWQLRYAYRASLDGQQIADLDASAFDWVERTRQVLIVDDTRTPGLDDALRLEARHVKSYASIPLLAGEKLLGVLSFVNYSSSAAFYASEVEFLNRLSALVAVILENAQLHEADARQRAELTQKVQELQAVLDLHPVGIGIAYDRECRSIRANPSLQRMLGLPAGTNPSLSAPPDERPNYRVFDVNCRELAPDELPMQAAAARGIEVRDVVLEIVRADGTPVTLLGYAVPLRDAEGVPCGAVAGWVDITERRQAELRAHRQKAIQEGINSILEASLTCATEEQLGRVVLEVAERVTGSKFGFLGEINAAGYLDDIALSDPGWEACRMPSRIGHHVVPGGFEIHGIYGRVLQDGKPLIANDPATHPDRLGTPEGHPRLTAFLGVPLVRNGQTIGMIGLGNRPGGYTADDLEAATALTAPTVEALGRMRTEERLRRSEEMARDLILNAPTGIYEVDFPSGRFRSVNDAMCQILGYSREELLGMSGFDLLDDAGKALFADRIRRTLAGEQPGPSVEYNVKTHDGRLLYAVLSTRITYRDGQPAGALVIAHDVTERRRAADELREQRERLARLAAEQQAILDAIADGLVIHDHEGQIQRVNRVAEEILGLTLPGRRLVAGQLATRLSARHPDGRAFRRAEYPASRALAGETVQGILMLLQRKDGTVWVSASAAPILDSDGSIRGAVATFTDITPLRATEAQLEATYDELKAANGALRSQARELAATAARFELLAGTASRLLAANEPQQAIDDLCRSVTEYLDAQVFFNFLVDGEAGRLRLNACGGISADEAARIAVLDYGHAICGCAAQDGCRIVVEHVLTSADPRTDLIKGYGVRAYAAHPLFGPSGEVLGTLSFGTRTRDAFSPADLGLMAAVADQVALAIVRLRDRQALQRAHDELERRISERTASLQRTTEELDAANRSLQVAMRELEASRMQLQALSHRLVEVQERERSRVADQLYNQASQVLAAVRLHLARLRPALREDARATRLLAETQEMLDGVMREMHHLATWLRPASLDRVGLVVALQQYAAEFGERQGLDVRVALEQMDDLPIPPAVETALYRIAQEALDNVAQHAEATKVDVVLGQAQHKLVLMIEDNGRGFDVDAMNLQATPGLIGMRERAAAVRGLFTVQTHPGRGTIVIVEVPF